MSGNNIKVLLVEDNESHAELVRLTLEDLEDRVSLSCVSDGEEALNYIFKKEQYSELKKEDTPDVILLDLRLPKVDGMEVLQAVKADRTYKKIPVVILTTSSAENDLTRAMDFGADNYIVKPLNEIGLSKILEDLGMDDEAGMLLE